MALNLICASLCLKRPLSSACLLSGALQAIVRCANPDQALDIPLTAPGSRSPECDALSTYSMTDLAQHESSRSETDLERNTAEVWSGSKDTTYNC